MIKALTHTARETQIDADRRTYWNSSGICRGGRDRTDGAAEQSSLKLLIGAESRQVDRSGGICCKGHRTRYQSAIVSPVESEPRPAQLRWLILNVRCLVESFVVIDSERADHVGSSAHAANLRSEEASGDAGHDDKSRESMVVRYVGSQRKPRNFRIVPLHREEDGRVAENAEVIAIVRVFPDVLGVHNEVFAKCLLEAGVKFVSESRIKRCSYLCGTSEDVAKNHIETSGAGENQVLVEGRFQSAGVGYAQHGIALLNVVGNTDARLWLARGRVAVVHIASHAQVEGPVSLGNGVLNVK